MVANKLKENKKTNITMWYILWKTKVATVLDDIFNIVETVHQVSIVIFTTCTLSNLMKMHEYFSGTNKEEEGEKNGCNTIRQGEQLYIYRYHVEQSQAHSKMLNRCHSVGVVHGVYILFKDLCK